MASRGPVKTPEGAFFVSVDCQPHQKRRLLALGFVGVVVLLGALAAGGARAADYAPPARFSEAVRVLEEHGAPCRQSVSSSNPDFWTVGTGDAGPCAISPPPSVRLAGVSIEDGNCLAEGSFSQPSSADRYACGFNLVFVSGGRKWKASCGWATQDEGISRPDRGWVREPGGAEFADLPACAASLRTAAPEARCDTYWVRPTGTLSVPAPGVLKNDSDPNRSKLVAILDSTNFSGSDHPYRLGKSGALWLRPVSTPGGKPFVAEITYHLENGEGGISAPAVVKVYIQKTKPAAAKLEGCTAPDEYGAHGKQKKKKEYDLASTCGTAKVNWLEGDGITVAVRKRKKLCYFLTSNRLANEFLEVAYSSPHESVSQAFLDLLGWGIKVESATDPSVSDYFEEKINQAVEKAQEDFLKSFLPDFVRRAEEQAGKADPLFLIGKLVGSTVPALGALNRIDQIKTKNACAGFLVRFDGERTKVFSQIIYNPKHISDRKRTIAKTLIRVKRALRPDRVVEKGLNLSCTAAGRVSTYPYRSTDYVFSSPNTVTGLGHSSMPTAQPGP